MSYRALSSQGCFIEYWNTSVSPDDWTRIAEVTSINGPDGNANIHDVSDLDSVWQEIQIGLPSWGPVTLECFYRPQASDMKFFKAAYAARQRNKYRLTWSDSPPTEEEFYGFVSSITINRAKDSAITGTVKLTVDGDFAENLT